MNAASQPRHTGFLAWLTPDQHQRASDILAALVAASLPWSTSVTSILVVIWAISLIPTIDPARFKWTVTRAACLAPLAIVLLALVAMSWSDAAWTSRLQAFGSNLKFLAIPLLAYQFSRSERAGLIAASFIGSCFLLMILSWIVTVAPSLALKKDAAYGVPVKNYIDQSQVFTFCAVFLFWPALHFYRTARRGLASLCVLASLLFLANMAFVNVSRTALITLPVLFVVFLLTQFRIKHALLVIAVAAVVIGAVGMSSALVRDKVSTISGEFTGYFKGYVLTSGGQRMEFWRKSLGFVATAPVIGHGTGSILSQFANAQKTTTEHAEGAADRGSQLFFDVSNPHNQLLNAAIQWGGIGIVLVLIMWASHAVPFLSSGIVQGAGLVIVVQNIIGAQFNSHLTDFVPGWMYVIGVGVTLGHVLREKRLLLERERSADTVDIALQGAHSVRDA